MQRRESREELAEIENGEREAKPVWRYLERIIFYGLLVVIALTAIPYGTVEPWSIGLFECGVFVLGALWFLTGLFKSDWRVPASRLLWPLLALVLFAGLQTINFGGGGREGAELEGALNGTISADPFETRLFILRLLALILTLVLLLRHTTSHKRLRALIYLVIGVGVVSALFGILRQTTHHNGLGYLLPFLKPNSGYGQFINRNHFAYLMEMSFGLVLGLLIGGGVSRERVLIYLSLALPLWVALILSNSRGGIFSMLVQLIFAALMLTFARAKGTRTANGGVANVWLRRFGKSIVARALLIIVLACAVGVSIIWIGGDQLATRIETGLEDGGSEAIEQRQGESRKEVWRATWALIKDNPLAGVGFGGYWAVIPKYHDASGALTPQQAHNDYLEILASGGIIGLALCAWFFFAVVRAALVPLRSTNNFRRAVCFGALVGLFGVAIHSLFDFGLHFVVVNSLIFIVLIVLAIAEVREPVVSRHSKEVRRRRLPSGSEG